MTILDDMLSRLTSNYNKDPNGNIAKLFLVVTGEYEELKTVFETITAYRDIDQARGATLDRIGGNILEVRGNKIDQDYRNFIKTKIRANLSAGDFETINEVLEVLLGDRFIGLGETWPHPRYGNEPAAFYVQYIHEAEFEALLTLNGTAKLDGEYTLKGTKVGAFESDLLTSIKQTLKKIAAGGVKTYWETPISVETEIRPENLVTTKSKSYPAINPLKNHEHNINIEVSLQNTTLKTARLDGSYLLNGRLILDGVKPGFISHMGTLRIYRSGVLEQEVSI